MRRGFSLKVNEADEQLQELDRRPFLYEKAFEDIRAESAEELIRNNGDLIREIDSVTNGVAIVTPDYRVVHINRQMRVWFGEGRGRQSCRCYRLFHNGQKNPCRECPARASMETKTSASVFHSCGLDEATGEPMYMHIHTFPIMNARGDVVAFVEYAYNLTEQRMFAGEISELRARCTLLEQENALLKKELEENRGRAEALETAVNDNMKNYVRPALEYLGTRVSREERRIFTSLIEESVFPITKARSARGLNLTARELQIAMMIREGQSSKQIADVLYITKKAVDYHRANIRKKLKIDAKTNLQNYLRAYL